jgi:hypothetical protein
MNEQVQKVIAVMKEVDYITLTVNLHFHYNSDEDYDYYGQHGISLSIQDSPRHYKSYTIDLTDLSEAECKKIHNQVYNELLQAEDESRHKRITKRTITHKERY